MGRALKEEKTRATLDLLSLKEIEVVKEERRWRTEDKPQSYAYEVLRSTAFQTSPYRLPIVATKCKNWNEFHEKYGKYIVAAAS